MLPLCCSCYVTEPLFVTRTIMLIHLPASINTPLESLRKCCRTLYVRLTLQYGINSVTRSQEDVTVSKCTTFLGSNLCTDEEDNPEDSSHFISHGYSHRVIDGHRHGSEYTAQPNTQHVTNCSLSLTTSCFTVSCMSNKNMFVLSSVSDWLVSADGWDWHNSS